MQFILSIFLAILVGLLLAPFYTIPSLVCWLSALICFALLFIFRQSRTAVHLLLCLLLLLFSNHYYVNKMTPVDDAIVLDRLARRVVVSGVVTDVRALSDERIRVDVSVDEIHYQSKQFNLSGPLVLRIYVEQGGKQFLPGDKIRFKSRLRQPRLFKTPGEFNWPRYLFGQGIDMTGWVKSATEIEVSGTREYSFRRIATLWRSRIATAIQRELPYRRALLVRALILGQGKILPDGIRNVLSQGGISHLFAISGLHLGLIALLAYRLSLTFYRRFSVCLEWQPPQRFLPLVILPILFIYLVFTGDAISTRRAFVLALLGSGFLLWRYCVNPLLLLVSLAVLSLVVNPLLLWQAGWQLSFAGAAGILVWRPWWQHQWVTHLVTAVRYPIQLALVTSAATLATLPLVLMNFHLFAPAGIIANLICVPVVTLLVLPLGLVGLILFPLLPDVVPPLFNLCGIILDLLVRCVGYLIAQPGLSAQPLFLSRWQYLAVAIIALIILVMACSLTGKKKIVLVAVAVAMASFWGGYTPTHNGIVSVTMFSVGQGESILLQNRQGQAVLVDGGGLYSNRFDVGERLLAPALGELNLNHLDAVVLTHDHPDHRKGLIYLLNTFTVDRFFSAHRMDELHPTLVQALSQNEIPFTTIGSGWNNLGFWLQGQLQVHGNSHPEFSENDSSLAIYLKVDADDGLLLTGDLEQEGVLSLLEETVPGPVSLLKLPHHGSRFSMTDKLIERLNPRYCLVSVGYQNRYRLPAKEVVEMLDRSDIPLFRTDVGGTTQAEYLRGNWHFQEWNQGFYVDKK